MISNFLNNIYSVFSTNTDIMTNVKCNENCKIKSACDDNKKTSSFQLNQGHDYLQNRSQTSSYTNGNNGNGNCKYNWKGDIIEGNTGMIGITKTETANNESLKEGERFIDKYNQDVSKYASKHKFLMEKTNNYLTNIKNPYKNKNIRLKDGQMGYVTAKGIFKWYPDQNVYEKTAGKNGCPSGIINVDVSSNNKFNTLNEIIYTDYPLKVGTQMRMGQSCGNEGENVFVSKTPSGDSSKVVYAGCYKRTNTGLDFQSDMKNNNVSFESCKIRAMDNGSSGFALSNVLSPRCYTVSDPNRAYSGGISTRSQLSYVLIETGFGKKYDGGHNTGGLLFNGSLGVGDRSDFSNSSDISQISGFTTKTLFSNPIYSGCNPNTGALINSSETIASYGANCNKNVEVTNHIENFAKLEKDNFAQSLQLKKDVKTFEDNFSYQGSNTGDQGGMIWSKGCSTPWNTKYKIGCEKNGQVEWSSPLGPVSHYNWQGPKIRIGPNGPTDCAKNGGKVKIQKSRNDEPWQEITPYNFSDNGYYDGSDSSFYDKITNCS